VKRYLVSNIKQKNCSLHYILFFWSLFCVIGHILYINTPLVNYEWVFFEGVKGIVNENYWEGLQYYFTYQANPLGLSICASITNIIFGLPVSYWSIRIPSLLGLILILYSFLSFTRYRNGKTGILSSIWCSLVILSPLIWILSGRAMAEVFSLGLVCFSYILCLKAKSKNNYYILCFLVFAMASLVKYNSAIFGVGIPYIVFLNNDSRLNKRFFKIFSLFCCVLLSIFIVYFVFIYKYFNIFFMGNQFEHHKVISLLNFPMVFLNYSYFLVLLLGPISLLSPIHLWGKVKNRTYFITVIVGIFFSIIIIRYGDIGSGEMGYSMLGSLLNVKMLVVVKVFCLLISIFLALDIFLEQKKSADPFLRFLIIITTSYLFVCSISRPVQRYLIFCLPFIYYFLVFYRFNYRRLAHVIILVVTLILFSITNITFALYQIAQASAADNMAGWISDANLMAKTHPGALQHHCGHYFLPFKQRLPKKYYVSEFKSGNQIVLHKEDVNLFAHRVKTYYCLKY
jgi:4-amino-4-deoxy-L-arabinose transferase-like glycosyltransferase